MNRNLFLNQIVLFLAGRWSGFFKNKEHKYEVLKKVQGKSVTEPIPEEVFKKYVFKPISTPHFLDEAGFDSFETGDILENGLRVGFYHHHKRTIKPDQNFCSLTLTLFFERSENDEIPEFMTIQGTAMSNLLNGIGSVSAASKKYSAWIGKSYSRRVNQVIFQ